MTESILLSLRLTPAQVQRVKRLAEQGSRCAGDSTAEGKECLKLIELCKDALLPASSASHAAFPWLA